MNESPTNVIIDLSFQSFIKQKCQTFAGLASQLCRVDDVPPLFSYILQTCYRFNNLEIHWQIDNQIITYYKFS